MSKKITGLQKSRENKQLLMSELESLEDKLRMLSSKAENTRKRTTTKRQNNQNLNSILDRWKDVNAQPPPDTYEPPVQEPPTPPPEQVRVEQPMSYMPDTSYLLPACTELEKSVLKQIKMCIQFILSHTSKTDPMLMTLISGTNDSVDDYEKLYTQLKLMVFMEKMGKGSSRNELMAFVFSSL
ncbi:hypothetical protein NEF87_000834 [Candidatus Lokiarchaeum ossiferum]|uniref:Uncharacterized protein n=1 Tax=Candidatus Lokiarchaeum ossiferum TaxID=2951803 RepID=A0ABY6HQ07_9ARCH|nr:hypothetical protein NEF87_000834 [Candidatus Lokiarchaeum sp. B-35]